MTPTWFEPEPDIEKEISLRFDERVEDSLNHFRVNSFYLTELLQSIDHCFISMDMEEEFENSRRLGIPIMGLYQHVDLVDFLFRFPPDLLNSSGKHRKGLSGIF